MTIEKFRKNKDVESVKVLETIHNDEITRMYHCSSGRCDGTTKRLLVKDVTTGHRWFSWM